MNKALRTINAKQSVRCPRHLGNASILSDTPIHTAVVDREYRGVEVHGTRILRSGQRRSAIEPTIGHMKSDGKLDRSWLKGRLGVAIHAILCGAGHNTRLLLRWLRLFYA